MNQPGAAALPGARGDPREQDRRLGPARLVCLVLSVLAGGLLVAAVLTAHALLRVPCPGPAPVCANTGQLAPDDLQRLHALGLSLDFYATYNMGVLTLSALGYWVVAGFLFWRRPGDRVALLAAVSLALFPVVFNDGLINRLSAPWWFLVHVLSVFGFFCTTLFSYVFPSGHFVPRFMRWVLVVGLVYWGCDAFLPNSPWNPFARFPLLDRLILLGLIASVIAVQVYRYRRVSTPAERRQTRWVVYGQSMGWGGYLAIFIVALFYPDLFAPGSLADLIKVAAVYSLMLLPPLSIGLAILRSGLWDIDLIINRTLVYGGLSVCVVGGYVLVVGTLGTLVGAGGNLGIELLATGLVALLFQPLRAWVQRGVNRLLYGRRDEPYAVITQLSRRLEDTPAPDAVLTTIVETVAQALKLPYAAIFLKQDDIFRPAAGTGSLVGEPLVLPLVYRSAVIGQLRLAPRAPGEAFTPADRRLLDELARQAGRAAHAVQLTADLQRSHEQLEQRVAERTRELASLLQISHTMAATLHLKPLLGLILDQLKLVIEYTSAAILTVEGDDLVVLDYRGPGTPAQPPRLRVPRQDLGVLWQTIAAGESIRIADVREDTPPAQAWRAAMHDTLAPAVPEAGSRMAVPLVLRDRVIGTLVLAAAAPRAFTERQETLALAIANQAALAIENARLYEQAQELAALEERQRLARELHDSVSQALYSIALGLHTARIQLERDPEKLPASIDDLLALAAAALAEMRALIFELRPESLEREGLVAALSRQGAALQARYDLLIRADLGDEPGLPLPVKQELYRIAQEALHNTVKHAHARKVDLVLRRTDGVVILEVGDDGVGFDPAGAFPGHLGLRSMQERVSNLGGRLQIASAPGQGTHLRAQVPVGTPDGG